VSTAVTINPTGYREALQDAWTRSVKGSQEGDDILMAPRRLVERVVALSTDDALKTDAARFVQVVDGIQRLVRQAGDAIDPATGELVPATDEQFDAALARLVDGSLDGTYPGVWPDDWVTALRERSVAEVAAELWNRLEPGAAAAEVEAYGIGTVSGLAQVAVDVPLPDVDPLDWLAGALELVTRPLVRLAQLLLLGAGLTLGGLLALRLLTRRRR
jgi:hypothetical protein